MAYPSPFYQTVILGSLLISSSKSVRIWLFIQTCLLLSICRLMDKLREWIAYWNRCQQRLTDLLRVLRGTYLVASLPSTTLSKSLSGQHPSWTTGVSQGHLLMLPSILALLSAQGWCKYWISICIAGWPERRWLRIAQELQARSANKKWREVNLEVGECVLLDGKNLRLRVDGARKLMHRLWGPFKIVKKVRLVAYELEIHFDMRMHDVIHVSLHCPYQRREEDGEGAPPALFTWWLCRG